MPARLCERCKANPIDGERRKPGRVSMLSRRLLRPACAACLVCEDKEFLAIIKEIPFQNPPPCEKLVGALSGTYSRRINIQHHLVYQVLQEQQTVKVLRLWSHYE